MQSGRRAPRHDWDWVGTEATRTEDITEQHLRRAAGWEGGTCCKLPTGEKKQQDAEKSGPKGKGRKGPANRACGEKACKDSPRCYNHLGGEQFFDEDEKESWVADKLGEGIEPRQGLAGLKNLGATCYANAFLQLWYHNVAFRNGLYKSSLRQASALYNLVLVFAQLQLSEQSVVDPIGLIEALRLTRGDQQDAAEFSNLFLSLITSELDQQPDPEVKKLVPNLFEGKVTNVTECGHCGYQSRREETFFELALALKNNITLRECFDSFFAIEQLTGADRYLCQRCSSLQNATRHQELSYLPPYLNLALMRFVYNPKKEDREKSKCVIKYPPQFSLGSHVYTLKAVITHLGSSAHHGHFVCDAYDSTDGEWYHCNDEEVTKKVDQAVDRQKKKARVDPTSARASFVPAEARANDEMRSSKDAYMLVYSRKAAPVPVAPPQTIMDVVNVQNSVFQTQLEGRSKRRDELDVEWSNLHDFKRDFLRALPGDDHLLPTTELKRWFDADAAGLSDPWDMSSIQCEHGAADPSKTKHGRLISTAAFNLLEGHRETLRDLRPCRVCVERGFKQRMASDHHEQLVSAFDAHNAAQRVSADLTLEQYLLPKQWVDAWRKGTLARGVLPTDPEYTIFCEHAAPRPRAKAVPMSEMACALLHSELGQFDVFTEDEPACAVCTAALDGAWSFEERWARDVKADKAIKKELDPSPRIFGLDYYVLPETFYEAWQYYMAGPRVKPKLQAGRCPHGQLDVDPAVDKVHIITQDGWDWLNRNYGPAEPTVLQYQSDRQSGLGTQVDVLDPAVCEPCRKRRLLDFTTATIAIYLEKEGASRLTSSMPVGRLRSRANEITVEVRKSTTIRDIKVEILAQTEISPINQRLKYRSRELLSDDTIEGLGVMKGDTLVCVQVEEKGDMRDVNPVAEGFGGTILVGAICCPICTLSNPAGSLCCEACDHPFGFQ